MEIPSRLKYTYNGADAVTDFLALGLRFREKEYVARDDLRTVLASYIGRFGVFSVLALPDESEFRLKPVRLGTDEFSLVFQDYSNYPPLFEAEEYRISDEPPPYATIHSDIIVYLDKVAEG